MKPSLPVRSFPHCVSCAAQPILALCLLATLLTGCGTAAAPSAPGQHPRAFTARITRIVTIQYLLYLPRDYPADASARWPLVLFLHGGGERGSDLEKVKTHGPPKLVAEGRDFPFILVAPQCPPRRWWDADLLHALLDDIERRYRVDKSRVYCTGLSMGGFGVWEVAAARPERFAAIAPICGGGSPSAVPRLKNVSVWVFHGAQDTTVKPEESVKMVEALQAIGGNVKFTLYPDADHDSWTRTYANPEFYDWLLSQER